MAVLFCSKSKIFPQAGLIDAQFGAKTVGGHQIFQISTCPQNQTGRLDAVTLQAAEGLGYTVQPDNYYDDQDG